MTPALVVKEGPLAGQRFEIEADLVVGREGEGVKIDDSELSRRHAVLRTRDGGLEIDDLGSLNGTFVNGSRIDGPTPLVAGDVVKVGTTSFEIDAPRSAETVFARPPVPPVPEAATAPQAAPAATPFADPATARTEAPGTAFGSLASTSAGAGRSRIASRRFTPTVLSFGAVIATAVALVLYFAQHEPSSDSGTNPCKLRAC